MNEQAPKPRYQQVIEFYLSDDVSDVCLLVSGERPDAEIGEHHVSLSVPEVLCHEVVAVDLEK